MHGEVMNINLEGNAFNYPWNGEREKFFIRHSTKVDAPTVINIFST